MIGGLNINRVRRKSRINKMARHELIMHIRSLQNVSEALLEYIDAIPEDTVLPTMPGIDRNYVEAVIKGETV